MEGVQKIVFFDGGCLLCSKAVKWTHRRDKEEQIWFAALESEFAAEHRAELGLPEPGEEADTFAFWDRGTATVTFKSEATFTLMKTLGGFWGGMAVLFLLVPLRLRDIGYDVVAKNRRSWFGTSEECALPPESLKGKVLA